MKTALPALPFLLLLVTGAQFAGAQRDEEEAASTAPHALPHSTSTTSMITSMPVPPGPPSAGSGRTSCPCLAGIPENEPDCGVPKDTVNGGCNSSPRMYGSIGLGDTVCGTAAYLGGIRDTDWYRFTLPEDMRVTVEVEAEFPVAVALIRLVGLCPPDDTDMWWDYGTGCGDVASVTVDLLAGTRTIFVAPSVSVFSPPTPCGAEYTVTLTGIPTPCDCQNGTPENEPDCGLPVDTVNGGCLGGPPFL